MHLRHVVESQQFDVEFLTRLMNRAARIKETFDDPAKRCNFHDMCKDKYMIGLIWGWSTRTDLSFDQAGKRLGMNVRMVENAGEFSSAAKGETIQDTSRVVCGYHPDIYVLRHNKEGSAKIAAKIADGYPGVSFVNAGDGPGQHPTQALIDIFSIRDALGTIGNQTVLIGGDLKNGRTVHSLVYLLAKYKNMKLRFLSLPELTMRQDILDYLDRHNVEYTVSTEPRVLKELLREADVVYWTRFQKEHENGPDRMALDYLTKLSLGLDEVRCMKRSSVILHPLPRNGEIKVEVDEDPRAGYFVQSQNGLYVRMALLMYLMKVEY